MLAPKLHRHAEQREEAGCDTEAFYVLGHAAARQVCIPALNSRELLESLALLAPVPEISGSHADAVVMLFRNLLPNNLRSVKVMEGKRPEHIAFTVLNIMVVRSDAQGQCKSRNDGERRGSCATAQRENEDPGTVCS